MHILVMSRTTLGHSLGGMQKQTMDLCEGFAAKGHQVSIITTARKDGVAHEITDGIETHYLVGCKPEHYSRMWNNLAGKKIAEIHQAKPINIIHSQSMGANGVIKWANQNSVPIVSTWHGTSLSELSAFFPQASYHPRYWHWLAITPATFIKRHFLMELPVRKASQAITLVSPTLEKHMIRHAKGKVVTIPNGVHIPASIEDRGNQEIIQIISIGRLVKQKGVQHAIHALAGLTRNLRDKTHLNIVGDGPYIGNLKALCQELKLQDNVTFHGRLTGQPLVDIYQKCSVHLMPTTSHEGLPLTILEGMAYGLATVASNIGGIPTAISDGQDGILIRPGNVSDLTNELAELIKNEEHRANIGLAARKTVQRRYSMQKMVDDTLEVLSRYAKE